MAQRRVLAEINANRRPNTELSNSEKQRLVGRFLAEQSYVEIAEAESLSKSTVKSVLYRATTRQSLDNKQRSGRPKKISERGRNLVIRYAREHPLCTYTELQRETRQDCSQATLKRILHDNGILNWRAKKRPHLTAAHAAQRLAFAYTHLTTDWSRVIFSDECSIEKGRGKQQLWAFGFWYQKWDTDKIQTYYKGKQGSVMVWGAIGGEAKKSDLITMLRDETSLGGGYTAASYRETLEEGLLPIYNGETFMQDNAPIHTAGSTTTWLADMGIYMLPNWPPFSPDLNCIEHIWHHLKDRLNKAAPHLEGITDKERQKEVILEWLPRVWAELSDELIDSLVESMPRRIQAIIDADGWQTRY